MGSENGDRRRQQLYRDVNLRIGEVAARYTLEQPAEFLCECGRLECAALITLTLRQWKSLVSANGCMLLAPGHVDTATSQRVIAENGRFIVVAAG